MSTGIRRAIASSLLGDSSSSSLAAGSPSTTVLQLGVGDAANWVPDEMAWITGTGATAANDRTVVRVTAVDTVLDRLTIEPAAQAVSVTPASGDELRRGVAHWIQGGTLVRYRKPAFSSPVEELSEATQVDGAVLFGFRSAARAAFDASAGTWEIRAIATKRGDAWCEGLADRLERLLDHQPLSVSGTHIARVRVDLVEDRDRTDELVERALVTTIVQANEEAA